MKRIIVQSIHQIDQLIRPDWRIVKPENIILTFRKILNAHSRLSHRKHLTSVLLFLNILDDAVRISSGHVQEGPQVRALFGHKNDLSRPSNVHLDSQAESLVEPDRCCDVKNHRNLQN